MRAEPRGGPFTDPDNPAAGRLDMEALTNSIFLVWGPESARNESLDAPPTARKEQ